MSNANCSGNTNGCQVIHPGWSCRKSSLQPVIDPDMLLLETETARSPELVPVEELVCMSPGVFLRGIDSWLFILYSFRACEEVVLRVSWLKRRALLESPSIQWALTLWKQKDKGLKICQHLESGTAQPTKWCAAQRALFTYEDIIVTTKKSSSSGSAEKKSHQTQQKMDSDGWRVRQE